MFLRELLRHLRGPVIVLLDNSSTHEGKPSNNFYDNITACISNTFPPMLRNSTPMKGFGLWQNVHSPIVAPMIWRSSSRMSSARSTISVPRARNYAAA